jgi:drug/metabolite transporter (DMT)-like permease
MKATPGSDGWLILKFLLVCIIWGSTWIALKICVQHLPPLFVAGSRFLAAGSLLVLAGRGSGVSLVLRRSDLRRFIVAGILVVAIYQSAISSAMVYLPSGLEAVVNLALTPTAMLAFGLMLGEETITGTKLLALTMGIAGLLVLFGPAVGGAVRGATPVALAAVVLGTICYAAGTVISRPLLRRYSTVVLAGWTNVFGGSLLLAISLRIERDSLARLSAIAWPAIISWIFLVLFGTAIAMTLFLQLVRAWGPVRAGGFAFLSPLIALAIGMVVQGEQLHLFEGIASAVLLGAVAINLVPEAHFQIRKPRPPGELGT